MRLRLMALLGVLMLCSSPFLIGREQAYGQSTQVDNARSALVQAFVSVQEADLQGASLGQISQLADSLNLALRYEENATRLGSAIYANESLELSNATEVQDLSFSNVARTHSVFDLASAYSLEVVAGLGSVLSVIVVHHYIDYERNISMSS